ncbi:ABC transporter ATP-binding protein [Mucilaginibacter conchicola]|uniref:ABC transporter ATP-binding protein n=1 Tax=Mucilaginibacter conchicola TaxID=2303333 RepID=A0A372NMT3_9SPHI|nr:ATP-binding cassette domain-containing protein [Mucilaginibacter conchicola]RFZ90246.1 ABC transporter ATP-binding protein [Mucilaginibacter conchicola]
MSIRINTIIYEHPDKSSLFGPLSLSIANGEKTALIGNNGVGKSTLLKIVAGNLLPSAGEVQTNEISWFVPQHLGEYDSLTIAEVLKADKKLRAIELITEGSSDLSLYDELEDDWEIETKVRTALNEWGLKHLGFEQRLNELSGGEKTKVFLAGISIWQPAVIVLDEPTNHLDASGRSAVYKLIESSPATILMVSHDRTLLNSITKTIEMTRVGLEVFGGNYEFYRLQKENKVTALQSQLDERAKTLKQTQQKARELTEQRQRKESRGRSLGQSNSLPRIISGGLKSKAEQSTAKLMDTHQEKNAGLISDIQELRSQIQQNQVLRIDIGSPALHEGKLLIDAEALNYSYNDIHLWELPLSFQIRSGERIQLSGDNGTGKSTLIGLITGKMLPSSGSLILQEFNFLHLDQDYSMIRPARSVYEQLSGYNARNLEEHELKSLLIYSQFPKESWDRKCGNLSGGEKMKLALCCLSVLDQAPDMLILDEPSNNLDIQSLETLTASLNIYKGTMLVVSHDKAFIDGMKINKHIHLKRS